MGHIHWLKAYTYYLATTGTSNASVKLQAVLAADPNGIFGVDYSHLTANTTALDTQEIERRTAWNIAKGIVAVGDAAYSRWVFGLYKDRTAWYGALPTDKKYARRLSAPRQALEMFHSGARVQPWAVDPAQWVFYTDLLVGSLPYATQAEDPRYLMIEQSSYQIPGSLTLDGAKVNRLDQMLERMGLGGEP
jgi:hypothetical protein